MAMKSKLIESMRCIIAIGVNSTHLSRVIVILMLFLLHFSCQSEKKNRQLVHEEQKRWENIIKEGKFSSDSLEVLLESSIAQEENVAIYAISQELGGRARITS